jgi:hypothetical protein
MKGHLNTSFRKFKKTFYTLLNEHSHKRENVYLEKLNKNNIQIFLIRQWEE